MPSTQDDDKVFDVAKPGKTAADPSGRPLLISNRSMVKDPMFKGDQASSGEIEKPDEKAVEKSEDDKPEDNTISPTSSKFEDYKSESTNESNKPSEKPEEKTETKEENYKKQEDDSQKETQPEADKPAEGKPNKLEKSTEAEPTNPDQANIDKLVQEEKYFLPIATKKRRQTIFIAIIAVFVVAGIIAVLAVALS